MDKDLSTPCVSVIMPVYNCRSFIKEAVESILNQTYQDFELFIIDDVSNDGTYELLQTMQDARIKLIRKDKNTGYVDSLNMGLSLARGIYIARMDGDDISVLTRFEHQIKILDSDKSLGLCGTNYLTIDEHGTVGEHKAWSENSTPLFWQLLWQNPIAHPSVMMRATILKQHNLKYDKNKHPAEDYDLWCRLILYTKFHRTEESLLYYRVRINSEFNKNKESAFKNGLGSLQELAKKLTGQPFPPMHIQQTVFKAVYKNIKVSDPALYNKWLKKLIKLLLHDGFIEETDMPAIFKEVETKYNEQIKSYWYDNNKYSLNQLFKFYCSRERYVFKYHIPFQIRFIIKCVIAYSKAD